MPPRIHKIEMTGKSTVFQFEIRYNHILNFSQIARKILSPYVRLADSIKIENQGNIEERVIFNFESDDYLIIVGWDRILIKGQGDIRKFTKDNSVFQTPYLNMLDKIRELEEFGAIQNILLASNYVKELKYSEDELVQKFMQKTLNNSTFDILDQKTDVAVTIEKKITGDETALSFGPYFGVSELKSRPITLVDPEKLEGVDFKGAMVEYKHFQTVTDVSFDDFVNMVKTANIIVEKVWKTL